MTSISIHRHLAAAGLAAFALLAGGLVAPATAATSTATITGVVTLEGSPVPFARVQLYRDNSSDTEHPEFVRVKTANSDSSGRYTLSKVKLPKPPAGSKGFRVVVTDRPGNVLKTVRVVKPKKGKTVTRNVATSRAAVVTGTLARSDGGDPSVLTLDVVTDDEINDDHVPAFDFATSTSVNADGTFSLGGLAPRTYQRLTVSGGPYDLQCFDFVAAKLAECDPRFPDSQRLSTATGEKRALGGITASKLLPVETSLSGKVTDTSGKALKGMQVAIGGAVATTRSSGRYTLRAALPAGTYEAFVSDPKTVWAAQYIGGGPDKTVKQQIVVTPGQPIGNLDTSLKSFATVKTATSSSKGTTTIAFRITRKATGSAPGGSMTLAFEGTSQTATVKRGKVVFTFTGLPKGTLRPRATYTGTSTTAGFSKTPKVAVK